MKKFKLENLRAQYFLPEVLGSEKVIFGTDEPGTFMLRNTIQADPHTFVAYRRSKRLEDRDDSRGVLWDTTVQGDLSDGWLSVKVDQDLDHVRDAAGRVVNKNHDHSTDDAKKARLPVIVLAGYWPGTAKKKLIQKN